MIEILHKIYALSNVDMIAFEVIENLNKNKADHLEINIFSLHFHL